MLIRKEGDNDDDVRKKLHEQRLRLELYESIIKLGDERWTKWQDIDSKATNDGKTLVNELLSINQYDLALKVTKKRDTTTRSFLHYCLFIVTTDIRNGRRCPC